MPALLAVWHNYRVAPRGVHEGLSPLQRGDRTTAAMDWLVALGYPPLPGRRPPTILIEEGEEEELVAWPFRFHLLLSMMRAGEPSYVAEQRQEDLFLRPTLPGRTLVRFLLPLISTGCYCLGHHLFPELFGCRLWLPQFPFLGRGFGVVLIGIFRRCDIF